MAAWQPSQQFGIRVARRASFGNPHRGTFAAGRAMQTLHLYDSSDRAIRRWGYVGIDQPGIVYTGVSGYQDIENEIRRAGGLGGKIGELWIHSHGAPGVIVIPLSGWFSGALCLDANNVGQLATVCRMFIATPGKVFFTGCNVGEGAPGDGFLRGAGTATLVH